MDSMPSIPSAGAPGLGAGPGLTQAHLTRVESQGKWQGCFCPPVKEGMSGTQLPQWLSENKVALAPASREHGFLYRSFWSCLCASRLLVPCLLGAPGAGPSLTPLGCCTLFCLFSFSLPSKCCPDVGLALSIQRFVLGLHW